MNPDPEPPPDEPILPAAWTSLGPLLDMVLDASPDQRAGVVAQLTAGNPQLRSALAQLVAECEREAPMLDGAAHERFPDLAASISEPALPELLGERYRIGRELGRGGMACVYLAHDLKHGRDVAIKVIRPELAVSLGHDRFLREIEIAARLRHPNIVPLYDSGEAEGALYFVMPYEEGPSLRAQLDRGGRLAIADALGVLRDIARALMYAHEHGVVHRDVKPDNVMLSGGAAVVTDFGIAKAVTAALTEPSATTITQTGSAIGTPAYMSPEQATGDPATDHRTDIYAFGCLAFELLTGRPPFESESIHQVVAAHLTTRPEPIGSLRPEVPAGLEALIARCLEKDPGARPQSAREILAELDGARPSGPMPVVARPEAGRARRFRAVAAAGAGAIVLAVAAFLLRDSRHPGPLTLAVLPFSNTDNDSSQAFVGEGLAEEVATELARVPGILIKSRSGARAYRGDLTVDVVEAGQRLKADYLLTAVVREDQGRWIVSADLARAADAASVWSENFNLGPDQHIGASRQIAASLTRELQRQFPREVGPPPAVAGDRRTSNDEAYRLLLRGQERLRRRGQSVSESAELFRAALQLDSLYAPAYSGLSMALALYPHFEGTPPRAVRTEVEQAAARALALDSTLPHPHIALGITRQFFLEWDSAAVHFEAAVRLDPHDVEARVQYARHLLFRGRTRDGLRQLLAVRNEDPASALLLSWISYAYYLEGNLDSALVESRRAMDNDSLNYTTLALGTIVRIGAGRKSEAWDIIRRAGQMVVHHTWVLAKSGDTAAARTRMAAEDAEHPQPSLAHTRRALGHLGLGDTAAALTSLERATEAGEIWTSLQPVTDRLYDDLRLSPRFQALLRRVGLTGI
jgi:serine/threonine-protein kinase